MKKVLFSNFGWKRKDLGFMYKKLKIKEYYYGLDKYKS